MVDLFQEDTNIAFRLIFDNKYSCALANIWYILMIEGSTYLSVYWYLIKCSILSHRENADCSSSCMNG